MQSIRRRADTAFGMRFRRYSIATLVVLVVSGALTFLYAPRLAANLPTPGMGLIERVDLGSYLLWVAVLATVLLRGGLRGAIWAPPSPAWSHAAPSTRGPAARRLQVLRGAMGERELMSWPRMACASSPA
jgi:hypothetical protein